MTEPSIRCSTSSPVSGAVPAMAALNCSRGVRAALVSTGWAWRPASRSGAPPSKDAQAVLTSVMEGIRLKCKKTG